MKIYMTLIIILTSLIGLGMDTLRIKDIKLNPKAKIFVKEVESKFDTIFYKPNLNENNKLASSEIKFDTAVISYNSSIRLSSSTLVHEFYHLKLLTEGYPDIWLARPPKMTSEEYQMVKTTIGNFNDIAQHSLLYPPLKNMGYDQSIEIKTVLQSWIKKSEIDSRKTIEEYALAYDLLFFKVNADDSVLLENFKSLLRNRYNGIGLTTGNRIVNKFSALKFDQINFVPSLVDLLNDYYNGKYLFSIYATQERIYKRFKRKIVTIEVKYN